MLCKWNRPANRTVESTFLTNQTCLQTVRRKNKPRPKSSLSDYDGRKPCQRSVNQAGPEQLKNKIALHNSHAPWLTLLPSTTFTACPQVQTDLPDIGMDFDLPHSGEVTASTSAAEVDTISNTETIAMLESSCSELLPYENRLFKMISINENLCVDDKEWKRIESETREQCKKYGGVEQIQTAKTHYIYV